jgi:hypothetical protein
MTRNFQMQRLFLIFCLIFVASAGAQERPLDGYCGPNSISEKIKHAYDTKSFYRAKRPEVLEFREKSIKNVRLVPLANVLAFIKLNRCKYSMF